MSETPATYTSDGESANLAAAALDALEWLQCYQMARDPRMKERDHATLGRCIAALEVFLAPHLPYIFEEEVTHVVDEETGT